MARTGVLGAASDVSVGAFRGRGPLRPPVGTAARATTTVRRVCVALTRTQAAEGLTPRVAKGLASGATLATAGISATPAASGKAEKLGTAATATATAAGPSAPAPSDTGVPAEGDVDAGTPERSAL